MISKMPLWKQVLATTAGHIIFLFAAILPFLVVVIYKDLPNDEIKGVGFVYLFSLYGLLLLLRHLLITRRIPIGTRVRAGSPNSDGKHYWYDDFRDGVIEARSGETFKVRLTDGSMRELPLEGLDFVDDDEHPQSASSRL
jgi:hypothetical protein